MADMPPHPAVDRARFHCDSRDSPPQISGICDAELDRLIDLVPTVADSAGARPLWAAYQRRLADLQPESFLYHRTFTLGVGRGLRGVLPDARGEWVGARDWWIHPEHR
jgi:ABC-type transport system substrate-binding protein